ncbi:MAG: T9SS type A sorting domain-containing protein [Bacteroidales bacterium]|nr:T9SS type A sorting domain-containing protein [Bacteroidales bacterium]
MAFGYDDSPEEPLYVALYNTDESIGHIIITNLAGHEVAAYAGSGERLDVSALPAGFYILTATSSSGNSYNTKFVKSSGE